VRGCRVHRLIARRARRLGSRRASHLIDVERKRSCTGSVHSSGSFCTKLENLALRTPPSWLAAGAPGRMPAVRRPAMHHSSLCAGAYLKGHRETRIGGGSGVWGTLESPGEKWGEKWLPFFPPRALRSTTSVKVSSARRAKPTPRKLSRAARSHPHHHGAWLAAGDALSSSATDPDLHGLGHVHLRSQRRQRSQARALGHSPRQGSTRRG